MIRSLAILFVTALTWCVAQAAHTTNQVSFRATVQDMVMLSSFSGTIIPVAVDPRYALTLRIESGVPGFPNITAGSVVTFAIHSPSLLFGDDDPKGKTYDFMLHRESQKGKLRYFGLEIQRKQANQTLLSTTGAEVL